MTKYYNTTVEFYGKQITFGTKVTDREEDRPSQKRVVAGMKMGRTFRELGGGKSGYQKAVKNAVEVSKKEMVKEEETLRQIEEAREWFRREVLGKKD